VALSAGANERTEAFPSTAVWTSLCGSRGGISASPAKAVASTVSLVLQACGRQLRVTCWGGNLAALRRADPWL